MGSEDSASDVIVTLPNGITIRRFRLTDVNALTYHANNKEVWNNLRNRMPHPYTLAESESWINLNLDTSKWVASGPYIPAAQGAPGGAATGEHLPSNYAICQNDEIIGSIGLVFGDENEIYCRTAEIGYWLSKDHWGRGIMGAVTPAFVEWAWSTFDRLLRINGSVMEGNLGSERCLQKAGLVEEGRKKMAFVKNGKFGTEIIMGALRPGMEVQE
jgi:[ribosomal protein S5]-alanine N-acetyltransferase